MTGRLSPQQIGRYLHRTHSDDPGIQICTETIYLALFAGALGKKEGKLHTRPAQTQTPPARRRRT